MIFVAVSLLGLLSVASVTSPMPIPDDPRPICVAHVDGYVTRVHPIQIRIWSQCEEPATGWWERVGSIKFYSPLNRAYVFRVEDARLGPDENSLIVNLSGRSSWVGVTHECMCPSGRITIDETILTPPFCPLKTAAP